MTASGFGAFGKIPSVGDFFRISAPPGFVSVWDAWLQECLVSGAHGFGNRWDDLYMSAPIWRFTLAAGLAGPQKIVGVLMASVDRVGRRFPLTLMAPLAGPGTATLDHLLHCDLFERLEDVALAALEDDACKDSLAEALSGLSLPETGPACHVTRQGQTVYMRQSLGDAATPALLAADCLDRALQGPSVWSATVEDDTRFMLCDGLPEGASMRGLFDMEADVWKAGAP